jgi:pilus assembly protein CpaB
MKNRNAIVALIAGIFFGLLAFYLLYQKSAEIERKSTPVEILVSRDYIPAGSFLNADMAGKKTVPESFVSPSAIHDIKEVEGLMTLVPISTGEQILSNKFGPAEESLAFSLNPGFRAYTMEVNETSGVGNLIRPGNRVDILAKINSNKSQITSFVFQNLQVLAVGQKMNLSKQRKKNQTSDNPTEDPNNMSYGTVTLAVTPDQAETLMFLEGNSLRLVLRAPHDDVIVSISPQSEPQIMSKLGHFVPKTRHSIEIFRGGSQ